MTHDERQAVLDEEHLRLLALFHYILGGVTVAGGLFMGVWAIFMAVVFASAPPTFADGTNEEFARQMQAMPAFMMAFFGMFAAVVVAFGVVQVVAGRCIASRRARLFTLLVAIPRVIFIPFGTLLSIFTFVVLERASVQQIYRRAAAPPPPASPGQGQVSPTFET